MPSTPRLLVAAAAGLTCANAAPGQFASDGLDPSVFNATMDFVVDPLMETLTVTVTNTTVAPDTFNINRIYFNGSDNVDYLTPGNSIVFVFEIESFGPGPVANLDFIDAFSTVPPGMTAMTHAAKFVQGPGDGSGYGARIPAPGSLVLLGIAGALLTRRRPRR